MFPLLDDRLVVSIAGVVSGKKEEICQQMHHDASVTSEHRASCFQKKAHGGGDSGSDNDGTIPVHLNNTWELCSRVDFLFAGNKSGETLE